jgi:putative hemolysin
VRLARQPNQFLATIQIGITLAGFLASAAAAVSLAAPLEEPLGFLGGAAGPASIVVVTLVLSYVTLVFGELAPKRVAMQKAEQWGLVMARPLAFMSTLTRPVVWLLSHSTDLAVRLVGANPKLQREEVTEEELRDMVAVQATFTPEQRQIIDGAFEIAGRTMDEVLVPRGDVFVVDASWSCEVALMRLAESGHSRAPVAEGGNLDEVIGGRSHAPTAR